MVIVAFDLFLRLEFSMGNAAFVCSRRSQPIAYPPRAQARVAEERGGLLVAGTSLHAIGLLGRVEIALHGIRRDGETARQVADGNLLVLVSRHHLLPAHFGLVRLHARSAVRVSYQP